MTNQCTPYYLAYERRYQAVYASGAKLWGHTADDEILIGILTDWVEKNRLRGKKVVEYACGEGSVGVILSKLGCIYHGIDIAPSAVARSKEALENYPDATVSLLDMVNERVEGLYDAAVDVMGLHMLVTDSDRKKYLDHVNAGLRANAPALFLRESYRKDLPSHTVDSIEQWVEITGDNYQTPAPRQITVNGEIRTVDIPLVPARAKNKTDYEKEMTESGFVVEDFIEMDISNAIVHSATLYVRKSLNDDNRTTDRIGRVRAYINNIFDLIEDADEKRAAYVHSYGVSHCCALLAAKRGLNMELAAIIGLLHDVYAYKTGVTAWHAQNGAELVRVAFKYRLVDLFTDEEQTIIKSAIYHHANKDIVHDEYDELLKDSDILQRLSFDTTYEWAYGQRLLRVMQELLLPTPKITVLPKKEAKINPFKQSMVGDIAETLAEKQIAGEKSNTEYMKIIRYFPEETAFDELKNAWCAAFVYHCCLEAGLSLPIRVPHTAKKTANYRFACVVAWYEWGMENGFCYFEKDGFIPERGDIVIYNNIIPREDKPENSTWCDHIGVVVSCDNNRLLVAEGNAGNKNVSGIITRKRDDTIGCYIRIPEDYTYDGWKTDAPENSIGSTTKKCLIIVYSYHHHNTAKIACKFAEVLHAQIKTPEQVTVEELRLYDLIGFGAGIDSGKHYIQLLDFADKLPEVDKKSGFIFSTSTIQGESKVEKDHSLLRHKLQLKGYIIVGEFSCKGFNTNSILKYVGGMNKGRPNSEDLEHAEKFALKLINSL